MIVTKIFFTVTRYLVCACLCWWGLLVAAQGAQGTQADPTEAAFGALLAMPASAPANGTWDDYALKAPADFDGEAASQEDLIAYLDGQRKRGARFDNYRLQGTLFHHAVRARLQNVAIWLLRHGANPGLKLEGGAELDGMGIAIKVGAWRVFDVLRKHPAYAVLSKEGLSERYGELVKGSPEALRALIERKLWVLGTPQVQAGLTGQLNAFFIQGKPGDALALLDANVGFAPASLSCSSVVSNKPDPFPAPQATPAQWRLTINRLPVNMQSEGWLCAFRYASTKGNAQAMLAASGIDLWRDPLFTTQTARLSLANAAWAGQLRAIPQAGLVNALANLDFQGVWLKGIANLPLADLEWALGLVKPVMTPRTIALAIGHWRETLGTPDKTEVPETIERWRLLAQAAPPGGGQAVGNLLYVKPVTIWAAWLARGYVLPQAELNYWLRDVKLHELKLAYPILQKHAPAFTQQALTRLVEPLSSGDSYGWSWGPDQLAKAELLESLGGRVEKPYPLAALFRSTGAKDARNLANDAAVAKAVERRWVLDVPNSQRQMVEVVKELGCKPLVSAAMRRSMAAWGRWEAPKADPYDVDASLSDAVPLQSASGEECIWLATGGEPPGRKFIYDLDFFEGVNRLTPCADGNIVNAVWDETQGDWLSKKDLQVFGAFYRLRIKGSKNEALLEWREGGGGCGRSFGTVYTAAVKNKKIELVSAERGNTVYDALVQQCDLSRLDECLALAEPQPAAPALSWSAQYLPNERRVFLEALIRFDITALNQAKEAGLFADWVQSGLLQLDESDLSPKDKRKRAAWLLAQRTLLANAIDSETTASLLRWLPEQDWRPVLYALRCERGDFKSFAELATAAKREDLLKRAPASCPAIAKK